MTWVLFAIKPWWCEHVSYQLWPIYDSILFKELSLKQEIFNYLLKTLHLLVKIVCVCMSVFTYVTCLLFGGQIEKEKPDHVYCIFIGVVFSSYEPKRRREVSNC